MIKLLIGVLLVGVATVGSAQIKERWVVVASSSEHGVSILIDVNTFSFKTGKTLDDSLAFARFKFTDNRAGSKPVVRYANGYVNLTGCVDGGGKLAIVQENVPVDQGMEIHKWTANGPTMGDGIGDALCAIYDVSQKR